MQLPPKKYELFDGFNKSSGLTKFLYIVSFPSLLVPLMVEYEEYKMANNRASQYQRILQYEPAINSLSEPALEPQANHSYYQDMLVSEQSKLTDLNRSR